MLNVQIYFVDKEKDGLENLKIKFAKISSEEKQK